jgi:hypothetical protein
MKAAASELGDLRSTLEGEAWSLEVLCAKILKRKTLYCCTADPQKPVCHGWSTRCSMRVSVISTPQHTTLHAVMWPNHNCRIGYLGSKSPYSSRQHDLQPSKSHSNA